MLKDIRTAMLLLGSLTVFASCDDSPTTPAPILWVGDLAATNDSDVTGVASVEAYAALFTASVVIDGGVEGAAYPWHVGEGQTCGEVEDRVGDADDYPPLEPNEEGAASAEATISQVLDPDASYHVALLASDEDDTVIACGELTVEE